MASDKNQRFCRAINHAVVLGAWKAPPRLRHFGAFINDVHCVVYGEDDGVMIQSDANLLAGLAVESQKYDGQTVAEFQRSFLFDSQMTRIIRYDFLT